MSEKSTSAVGYNNFDFLRFLFASLVVFSHSFPLASGNEDMEPLARLTRHQLTFGSLAVDCFFIISGFLIAQSWIANPTLWPFLRKRIRRIYPGFITAALIGAFVVTPLFSSQGSASITLEFVFEFAKKTARLLEAVPAQAFQNNPAPGVVNGSLWSISYEFWCYIGVMACGTVGLLQRPKMLVAATTGAIAISFVFAWFNLTPGGSWLGKIFGYPPFWARLLPYFLVGMAFGALRESVTLTSRGALVSVVAFAVASQIPHAMIFALPLAASYLIFWFAFKPMGRLNRFAKYGDFSYGIYLYSFPVLQVIVACLGTPTMDPLILFAIGWPVSITVAALSWHVVERHWIKPKSHSNSSPVALAGAP